MRNPRKTYKFHMAATFPDAGHVHHFIQIERAAFTRNATTLALQHAYAAHPFASYIEIVHHFTGPHNLFDCEVRFS